MKGSFADKIADCIPDYRNEFSISHTYREMVLQRIGQILCGHVDDTNANIYGAQQLTLFNDYYGEYCYMPMLMFDGLTGKLILPLLHPGASQQIFECVWYSQTRYYISSRMLACQHY